MVWAVVIIGTVVAVLAFLEWRSWRKPLARGLDGSPSRWSDSAFPPSGHGELKNPHH
jgi:hypothetical protein